MEREDAVDDGVDGLAVGEGVFDEADVACCGCGVEAEVGDCEIGIEGGVGLWRRREGGRTGGEKRGERRGESELDLKEK